MMHINLSALQWQSFMLGDDSGDWLIATVTLDNVPFYIEAVATDCHRNNVVDDRIGDLHDCFYPGFDWFMQTVPLFGRNYLLVIYPKCSETAATHYTLSSEQEVDACLKPSQ